MRAEPYSCRLCGRRQGTVVVSGMRDWEYGAKGEYAYLRCGTCGMVQIHPFPSLEDLIEAYKVDYHGYAELDDMGPLFKTLYDAKESVLERRLRRLIPAEARVLDVGCGNGKFLSRARAKGASYVEGIDFSPRAVARLQETGITAFLGTFLEYSKPDGFFDLIAMNNYLEHTLEPLQELVKARRLLKAGGYLTGEVPGFDSFERRIFGKYWGGNHVPRHTFQFEPGSLRSILEKAGFREIQITHDLNTGHWALSVQNLLHRNGEDRSDLRHGRAWYYFPLLLAFVPVNVFCVLARRAGVVKLLARA